MKKQFIVILIIIFAVGGLFLLLRLTASDNKWVCQNNQWIKVGNPSEPMPDEPCGNESVDAEEDIIITKPIQNEKVESPIEVEGQARGFWFFEASFPIELLDNNKNVISTAIATAQGDWMTEEFVQFKAEIEYSVSSDQTGYILFKKDNPSGIPEFDDSFTLPVSLVAKTQIEIEVFFNNDNLDPEISCNRVFSVSRFVDKTDAVGSAAVAELLKGPTIKEKNDGYYTSINDGVKLLSLNIENQTAYADFSRALDENIGGSCRVSAIRAQIEETLKQFSTIDQVVISIEGETEEILQP